MGPPPCKGLALVPKIIFCGMKSCSSTYRLADASKQAITKVTEAIGEKELPVVYLLGEKYISSLQQLSESGNSKFVVLPADIPAALQGLMGKK